MIYKIVDGQAFRNFQQFLNGRLLHITVEVNSEKERVQVYGITDDARYFAIKLYESTEYGAVADAVMIDIFGANYWLYSIPVTVNA